MLHYCRFFICIAIHATTQAYIFFLLISNGNKTYDSRCFFLMMAFRFNVYETEIEMNVMFPVNFIFHNKSKRK